MPAGMSDGMAPTIITVLSLPQARCAQNFEQQEYRSRIHQQSYNLDYRSFVFYYLNSNCETTAEWVCLPKANIFLTYAWRSWSPTILS
jgi:hypothetical protein